jgi:hypothetical protein
MARAAQASALVESADSISEATVSAESGII